MKKSPLRTLVGLQRWMQSAITHPGGVERGAVADEACAALEGEPLIDSVIDRSRAMSAVDRLSIYNRAYFARLLECLREEFSVLAKALGDDLFDSFALGYLQQYPPRSYTLAELGSQFPQYLSESRPEMDGSWPEFLVDLVRLELAVNQVFDGPGCEGETLLDETRIARIPPDRWPEARLRCVPCLRLLALSYPVNEYFTALRRGEPAEIPEPADSFIAVTRREFRVHRYPLTRVSFRLLSALQSGDRVGEAIEAAAAVSQATDDELVRDLRGWFFTWTAAGFFHGIELPGERGA